jgi:hypothetical protein
MIRNTSETQTEFHLSGIMLTEKMKRALRRRGLKNNPDGTERTWAEVFRGSDVVYRFNPTKNKQDVYVGRVYSVRYPSGKAVSLRQVGIDVFGIINENIDYVPVSRRPTYGYFRISSNRVVRDH